MDKKSEPLLFAGSSHPVLAAEVSAHLGIELSPLHLKRFPDGEISVEIVEDVRGKEVFVLQSIALDPHFSLMELLIIVDALKRSAARSITAIIPHLAYCRQDRRNKPGVPITAKLVANLLTAAGVTHLITCDLHADQVEGFFEIPVDHLYCQELLCRAARELLGKNGIVVAPDIGSIKIAERMAKLLQVELAVIKKERLSSFDVKMTLIGDVSGKNVLIADDLCSTAGTLVEAAHLCRSEGASSTIAAVTHGLFVANSLEKIDSSPLEALLIANTIAQSGQLPEKIKVLSISREIASAIDPSRNLKRLYPTALV
jgi:ribose-phosphate pyrophosphokinase